jgi:hypothetical protein
LRLLSEFVLPQIPPNVKIVNIKDVSHQLPNKRNMSRQASAYDIEKLSAARKMEDDKRILFSVDRIPEKLDFEHLPSGRPVRAARRFEELGRKNLVVLEKKIERLEHDLIERAPLITAETAAREAGEIFEFLLITLQQYSKPFFLYNTLFEGGKIAQ